MTPIKSDANLQSIATHRYAFDHNALLNTLFLCVRKDRRLQLCDNVATIKGPVGRIRRVSVSRCGVGFLHIIAVVPVCFHLGLIRMTSA